MATTRAGSGQIQPNLKIQGSEGIVIPVGTTAQRNPNPVEGEIRFNTDLNTFEGYTGQVWGGMGPFPFVRSEYFEGDGSTYTFALDQQVANDEDLTVLLNGVQLRPGIDFQLVGQRNIIFEEDDGSIRPPLAGSTISIRYFVPITSASVIANSISIEELAVVPGTEGQLLSIDQNQALFFTSQLPVTSVGTDQLIYTGSAGLDGQALLKDGNGFAFGEISDIAQSSIGIRELNVSDGQIGQVLATDGSGNLSFITVSSGGGGSGATNFFDLDGQIALAQIPDNFIDIQKLDVTDGTNGQVLATNGQGELFFTDAGGSSGEANDGINLGTGVGIFDSKSNTLLQFNSISAGNGISVTETLNTIQITNTSPNVTQNAFTTIQIAGETSIAADTPSDTLTLSAGSGITLGTDPATDTITITSTAIQSDQNLFETIVGDTGSVIANNATDTLNIIGGTDIETSISGDTLTINYTGLGGGGGGNAFTNIAVSGQSTVIADSTTDTLNLVAGSGIVITTNDTNDQLTFSVVAGAGTGVINSGDEGSLAYYASTGTTISTTGTNLTWDDTGNTLSVAGTIEAQSIESTGTGTPTFTSGNDIKFNAANGAGEVQVTGDVVVSGIISGDGSGLTNLPSSGSGIADIVEDLSPQLGSDLDTNGNTVQYTFNVVNNGSTDYTFTDPGSNWFPTAENDPVLYLRRGETYVFSINAVSHPFEIRVSSGGSAYSTGVTNNAQNNGNLIFTVPMSAPSTLYYQCTIHGGMGNTINIV